MSARNSIVSIRHGRNSAGTSSLVTPTETRLAMLEPADSRLEVPTVCEHFGGDAAAVSPANDRRASVGGVQISIASKIARTRWLQSASSADATPKRRSFGPPPDFLISTGDDGLRKASSVRDFGGEMKKLEAANGAQGEMRSLNFSQKLAESGPKCF